MWGQTLIWRQTPFALTRQGKSLYDYPLNSPFDAGLRASPVYHDVKAILRCNGTLADVKDYYKGYEDRDFLDFCVSFYLAESQFDSHLNDAFELEKTRRQEADSKK